jgi:steroid 5-alpha reductase family enzyme
MADNQQYSYQTFKHSVGQDKKTQEKLEAMGDWIGARIRWTEDDRKRGFVTKGLWAWSRHPNFLCEQSFWVSSRVTSFRCSRVLTPR